MASKQTYSHRPTETTELQDGTIVRASQIIGTPHVIISAWHRASLADGYSTITYVDGYGWLGRIGTEKLPDEIAALQPYTDERALAATKYFTERRKAALDAINQAYLGVTDALSAKGEAHAFSSGEVLVCRDDLGWIDEAMQA